MKNAILTSISTFVFLIIFSTTSNCQEEAPPPPPPAPQSESIFRIVEEMPRFPGCEDQGLDKSELKKCAEGKMLKYVYSNIIYPKVAKENKLEGRVIAQFVVDKDGSIINIKVLHDVGGGCGDEVTRVLKTMPKWIPGKQRGKPIKVQYTLPISFKMDKKEVVEEEEIEEVEIDEIPPMEEELIFKVVEDMPMFPGCEDPNFSRNEIKKCSDKKMFEFIKANLQYPKEAKKNGVEGRVILQFVVQKDGSLSNIKVIRNISNGCGEEAVRVVKSMPKFKPGKQRGKTVKVQYTLPISFRL